MIQKQGRTKRRPKEAYGRAHVVCFGLLMVRSIIRVIGIRMPIEMHIRIPKVYPVQSPITCRLFRPAAVTSSYIRHMAQMGVQTWQIQVSSGSNGSLNRTEVTVNLKTGQLLILRPMGASNIPIFI